MLFGQELIFRNVNDEEEVDQDELNNASPSLNESSSRDNIKTIRNQSIFSSQKVGLSNASFYENISSILDVLGGANLPR